MTWGNRWWPAVSAPAPRRSAPHRNAHSTSGNAHTHTHTADRGDWLSSVLQCDTTIIRSYLSCRRYVLCVCDAEREVITSKITIRLSGKYCPKHKHIHRPSTLSISVCVCVCSSVLVSVLPLPVLVVQSSLNHPVHPQLPEAEPRSSVSPKPPALLRSFPHKNHSIWNID